MPFRIHKNLPNWQAVRNNIIVKHVWTVAIPFDTLVEECLVWRTPRPAIIHRNTMEIFILCCTWIIPLLSRYLNTSILYSFLLRTDPCSIINQYLKQRYESHTWNIVQWNYGNIISKEVTIISYLFLLNIFMPFCGLANSCFCNKSFSTVFLIG